jgi:hypothetical protein
MSKIYGIICLGESGIRGIRIRRVLSGIHSVENVFAALRLEPDTWVAALNRAGRELDIGTCDYFALTGRLPGAGCFELTIPRMKKAQEQEEALWFELSRHIPSGLDGIIWNYRIIDYSCKQSGSCRIRVFFMHSREWENYLNMLRSSDLMPDDYIYPFMAADPELEQMPVCLPEIDSRFYLTRPAEDGLRRMELIAPDIINRDASWDELIKDFSLEEEFARLLDKDYAACLLVANYVMNGHHRRGTNKSLMPREFKPQRLKVLKAITLAAGILAALGILFCVGQKWSRLQSRYNFQQRKIVETIRQLEQEKLFLKQNAGKEKLINKILSSIPSRDDNLAVLSYLAQIFPKEIWLNDYRLQGDKVYLTIKCSAEPEEAMAKLGMASFFTVDNLRKTRNPDGSYYIYVILSLSSQA